MVQSARNMATHDIAILQQYFWNKMFDFTEFTLPRFCENVRVIAR